MRVVNTFLPVELEKSPKMKILIAVATYNRPIITGLCLQNLQVIRDVNTKLVIYDDHSEVYPKEYLLNFLANKALQVDKQVMRMMILLLAKICKLSWFDHPELQTMITDITHLFSVSFCFFEKKNILDEHGALSDSTLCSRTNNSGDDIHSQRQEFDY